MTDISTTDDLFFTRTDLDQNRVEQIVKGALEDTDDGE